MSSYTKRKFKRRIKIFEIVGIIIILMLSSLFHFCFEWFGKIKWTAAIFAVNESVWEHLKIGFFAAFFYAFFEFLIFGRKLLNFIPAKAVSFLLIPLLTAVFFYTYTAFMEDNLFFDIMTLVLAVIIAQVVSIKIMLYDKKIKKMPYILLIIFLLIIFPLLTFYPPKISLFYDFSHRKYGI